MKPARVRLAIVWHGVACLRFRIEPQPESIGFTVALARCIEELVAAYYFPIDGMSLMSAPAADCSTTLTRRPASSFLDTNRLLKYAPPGMFCQENPEYTPARRHIEDRSVRPAFAVWYRARFCRRSFGGTSTAVAQGNGFSGSISDSSVNRAAPSSGSQPGRHHDLEDRCEGVGFRIGQVRSG
jgi:hypothetical protein